MVFNSKLPTKLALISLLPTLFATVFVLTMAWLNESLFAKFISVAHSAGINTADATHWHTLVLIIAVIGCIVNTAATILLVKTLGASITGRISALSQNAKRFASGEELLPPQPGADELSELDSKFYQVWKELEASRTEEANLKERKNQLIAMISHDLKTPLTSTSMFLELLANDQYVSLPTEFKEKALVASNDAKRLLLLTENLLDLELLEAGRLSISKRTIKCEEVIYQSTATLAPIARSAGVDLVAEAEPCLIYADADRLVQAIGNLLSNAIRFSKTGQQVSIKGAKAGNLYSIIVIDHGPGIDPEHASKIFNVFSSVVQQNYKRGKAGLGLAISKQVVELHSGQIAIEETPGGGATFILKLPIDTQSSITAEPLG